MVGHIAAGEGLRIRLQVEHIAGLPLLRAGHRGEPESWRPGALRRTCRILRKRGVRNTLAPSGFSRWEELSREGIMPVETGAFCRAQASAVALASLRARGVRPETASVALRGLRVSKAMREAAWALCSQVRVIFITAPLGGEELRRELRREFGVPDVEEGEGESGVLALHFDPVSAKGKNVVDLSGPYPKMDEFTFYSKEQALSADCESLPLLALLWENGRISEENIAVFAGSGT